jgi:serine/threonine protein kinase
VGDNTLLEFGAARSGPLPAARRVCSVCQSRLSGDARFCPFDGYPLDPGAVEPARDALLGTVVDGRYQVLDVLGEGGMGTVYRVRHAMLEREFALKALKRNLAQDTRLCLRFLHEARAAARVRHPAVVEITDFGQLISGQPYFIMELLMGKLLSQVIHESGPLPTSRVARILGQIAEALQAAHEAGVVHRDLKPANVCLLEDGCETDRVKVLDFGLAQVAGTSKLTLKGVAFGTPHYMSPEQAMGGPIDHRADVYTLGVVAYQMLTGRVPFDSDSSMEILTQHVNTAPIPPGQLLGLGSLGALETITLCCLEKRPESRYGSMGEFLDKLRAVDWNQESQSGSTEGQCRSADRTPSIADAGDALPTIRPWGQRVRWMLGAAGAGAAVALLWVYFQPRAGLPATDRVPSSVLPTFPSGGQGPTGIVETPVPRGTAQTTVSTSQAEPSSRPRASAKRPNQAARESGTLGRKVESVGEIVDPWDR